MHIEKKRNNKKGFSRSFSKSSYQQTMHTATILFIRKIVLELILVMLISYFLFIILFLAGRLWYELFWSAPREAPVALALGPGADRMCVCLCVCVSVRVCHTHPFLSRVSVLCLCILLIHLIRFVFIRFIEHPVDFFVFLLSHICVPCLCAVPPVDPALGPGACLVRVCHTLFFILYACNTHTHQVSLTHAYLHVCAYVCICAVACHGPICAARMCAYACTCIAHTCSYAHRNARWRTANEMYTRKYIQLMKWIMDDN